MQTSRPDSPIQGQSFNEEPVYYCAHCLSLKIREVNGLEFCDNCNSTDIETSSLQEWEEKYEQQYGHKFIQ